MLLTSIYWREAYARLRSSLHGIGFVFGANRHRLRLLASLPRAGGVIRANGAVSSHVLALSFDDGPSPATTPVVLDVLARHEAHATFFMVGELVEAHPDIARAVAAAGHEIGNHSYRHLRPSSLTYDGFKADMRRGSDTIERVLGVRPTLARPPYGDRARDLVEAGASDGVTVVLWSVDSGDAAGIPVERVSREVVEHARPGDIVLLHDGDGPRPVTIAALEAMLEALGRRGWRCVTVTQLLSIAEVR